MTTELDSLPSGSIAYAANPWDNSTTLDIRGWLSTALASVAPSATSPTLDLYLLPLNEDGSTYGDQLGSVAGTQQTALPSYGYYAGAITFPSSSTAAAQTGRAEIAKDLPAGEFLIGIANQLGSALGTGNTVKISTNSEA